MAEIKIRIADPSDAGRLLEIYGPYVENTAVTFEYLVPSREEFRQRICRTLERYPYLVAEEKEEILGYCYAGPLHVRAAYAWSAETSIYVKMGSRQQGIGRLLYEALETVLKKQNVININACIAWPETEDRYLTRDSVKFHQRMGYHTVAEFHQCAYKFERWYHMVWMEKFLGEHPKHPEEFIPFQNLRREQREWER